MEIWEAIWVKNPKQPPLPPKKPTKKPKTKKDLLPPPLPPPKKTQKNKKNPVRKSEVRWMRLVSMKMREPPRKALLEVSMLNVALRVM